MVKIHQMVTFVFVVMAFVFLMYCNNQKVTNKLACVQVLYPWWYGTKSPAFAAYRMTDDLNHCFMSAHIRPALIIMPESTFCFDILSFAHFIPLWCENLDHVVILFGTHEHHEGGAYNVVYCICDGSVVLRYRKQHLMPFVEYHPAFLQWFNIPPLCTGVTAKIFKDDDKNNEDVIIINNEKYQIFVCSELFFYAKGVKGLPIIFLWNDAWLPYGWMKKIALWYIDLFAWFHHIKIWHVSTTGITNIGKVDNFCYDTKKHNTLHKKVSL